MRYYSESIAAKTALKPVHVMSANGYQARLMRAKKLPETTFAHGLPPGESIPVFPVDAFLDAPQDWVKGQGSYVCPVDSEWGLWFDWTMNNQYDTAVIPSVKGMNPITGQKIEGLALERYQKKCPIHGTEFVGDLLCEKCGYKWPPQNYISAPNTLWWDGFRAPDGTVRQFFFSKDEEKDIASAVIGKHNVVPAFGFCFYRSKKPTVMTSSITRGYCGGVVGAAGAMGGSGYKGLVSNKISTKGAGGQGAGSGEQVFGYPAFYSPVHVPQNWQVSNSIEPSGIVDTCSFSAPVAAGSGAAAAEEMNFLCADGEMEEKTSGGVILNDMILSKGSDLVRSASMKAAEPEERAETEVKKVAVGAGAKINQVLVADHRRSLKDWRKKNAGIIRLYFCFEAQFSQLVKGGVKDLEGDKDGFLKGLPVGG